MSSSEFLRCKVCRQDFETIDSLKEHQAAEKEEQELRNKGFADG
jgi:hypothetical protein